MLKDFTALFYRNIIEEFFFLLGCAKVNLDTWDGILKSLLTLSTD